MIALLQRLAHLGRLDQPITRRESLRNLARLALGARMIAGCANDAPNRPSVDGGAQDLLAYHPDLVAPHQDLATSVDMVQPANCSAYGTTRDEALRAYRDRIASPTFLGTAPIENGRLALPANWAPLSMFLNDGDPNLNRVAQHQALTGKPLAVVKSYWAFARGFDFPTSVAQGLQAKGAALFLALEPWSWNGAADNSFSLARINSGEFDAQLKQFFSGAAAFGGPLIFSFMHEFNGNWYPWAGDPVAFVAAWRRIHNLAQQVGANNITWAWIMNADTVGSPTPEQ